MLWITSFLITNHQHLRVTVTAFFGKVISGMDVVDNIKSVSTGNSGYFQDVPLTDVVIKSIDRKKFSQRR